MGRVQEKSPGPGTIPPTFPVDIFDEREVTLSNEDLTIMQTVRVLLGLVVLVAAWLAHWLFIETKACCPDSLGRPD